MIKSQTFKSSLVISLLLLLLFSLATLILAEEVEDESEFNYIEGDKWGPENWGNIKEEWALCNTGKMQSPIDLLAQKAEPVPESEKINRVYNPGQTLLKNRGHDIALEWVGGDSRIQLNGKDYTLLNYHWHSPSEHAINGKRYALEGHFVHQAADKSIAVIGFLYKFGRPDPFLSSIEAKLKVISGNSSEVNGGVINPLAVQKPGKKYYRYRGSLTTPACDEGVIWTVQTKPGTVSKKQVDLLRNAVHDGASNNARPLQATNGREVHIYKQNNLLDTFIRELFAESM